MAASASIQPTIYSGAFAHSVSLTELEVCEAGLVGVDAAGVIRFVEKGVTVADAQAKYTGTTSSSQTKGETDWNQARIVALPKDAFLFPGLIDTHTHAPQHPNTGLFGKSTLLDWLETYTFPLEASLASLPKAQRVYNNFVSRTLANGTTTCAYYATRHVEATNALADICLGRGQRAFVGRVCMDRLSPEWYRDESAESAVADSRASIEYIRSIDPRGDVVQPIITPRFAPSCTTTCLAGLGDLARETDAHIQTHISENRGEIALVAEQNPDAAHYAGVYDAAGLLTPKTILAHAVHLDADERALVKQRQAKIAHCPASNTALTSGCCPVREYLDAGITVGLGTDVSGGFSPSILEECRQAIWVSRFVAMRSPNATDPLVAAKLSTAEALYLATRGGAAVVGLEDKVGGFDVGKEFDAQMVRLGAVHDAGDDCGAFEGQGGGPVDVFGWESAEEKLEKWVYSGDDRNCVAVWVRGRLVHKTAWFEG